MTASGIYRAKVVAPFTNGSCDVVIPQLFGEVVVNVSRFVGSTLPLGPDMGWVMFEGGDENNPVWMDTDTSVISKDWFVSHAEADVQSALEAAVMAAETAARTAAVAAEIAARIAAVAGVQASADAAQATANAAVPASVLTTDGDLLSRAAGVIARLTRANLAADAAFSTVYAPISRGIGVVSSIVVGASDQTGIGASSTALTGYSITFTAVSGHRYLLFFVLTSTQQTVGNVQQTFDYQLAGVDQAIIASEGSVSTAAPRTYSGHVDMGFLGTGSKTISISGRTSGGTMSITNASVNNGRMTILDLGT